jgi:cytochrome c
LLRQIKAMRRNFALNGSAIIRNHAMRFAALLLALALFHAPLAAQAGQAADADAGKAIFNKICNNCHSIEVGVNKIGPSLSHIVDRPSAAIQGYNYSKALKSLHRTWTSAALDTYLADPRSEIHGVAMYFKGLPDPKDRADVIAYLQSLQ